MLRYLGEQSQVPVLDFAGSLTKIISYLTKTYGMAVDKRCVFISTHFTIRNYQLVSSQVEIKVVQAFTVSKYFEQSLSC